MTLGNLTALKQDNIVRMLAYSSIAQGGFILVPFAAAAVTNDPGVISEAASATITYIIIYAFMNLGSFAVVIAAGNRLRSAEIGDWAGIFSYSPGLATMLAIFFFSLAGIPPLAGWFAKFVMFRSVISVGGAWAIALAVIAVVNSVIAFVYYAKVVKSAFMDQVPDHVPAAEVARIKMVPSLQFAMALTVIGVIVLGAGLKARSLTRIRVGSGVVLRSGTGTRAQLGPDGGHSAVGEELREEE